LARKDSLWCLDVESGRSLWVATTSGVHTAPPVIAGGTLLSISYEGEVVGREVGTGVETTHCSVPAPQIAAVADGGGQIAAVSAGGELDVRQVPSLEPIWSRSTGETVSAGVVRWGPCWVVPCQSGRVLGLTLDRGTVAWTLKLRTSISVLPGRAGMLLCVIDDGGRAVAYKL